MQMFQVILIKNDGIKSYDITPIVGSFTWDSNLSLMAVMEFNLIWSDIPTLFPKNPCDAGDAIMLMEDNVEVYRGIIVTEGKSGREAIKYTVYDYAWYLGNSKSVYQFILVSASQAITRILNDFGMLIGSVPSMNTMIDKIYIQKSPAAIIEDIIKMEEQQTGKRFNVELREGKFFIEPMNSLLIKGTFKTADNINENDVLDNPLSADRTRSIKDMRNRIKVIVELDNNDKSKAGYVVTATAQDTALASKYGLLEEVVKVDAEDAAKSREVARILLQRMGKVQETNSIKLMGDIDFKAGRLFEVNEPITGMSGTFMIKTAKHEVSNQIHTMELELVFPEEVKPI
jgi:hypothetical protein